jgi:hypothetical protein
MPKDFQYQPPDAAQPCQPFRDQIDMLLVQAALG